ncbi:MULTISPECIES: FAD-dependent oxidoreductase [unclassified Imperialibacter]|uniref:FAD-dependent oxidoreductase n=1 Tax=unclassified Imperialibacter TaxID=2629706 RepID=UPI001255F64D|nr:MULTISPECIES: FAD-dependent oxidoreductase [unclassified Imperialibacter]CAD5293276.1 Response regulator [Imperialibacter sp. 89]CAD5294383.1 Response regulator [Imperialibacter sp. 75]VVT18352.1 Fused response regulator/thioredoxin-disulfide reductase [Imperialibacter sp. EC-SDR9]
MKKPVIFSVDDDPQVLKAIRRDLRNEFRDDYRIMNTESANEGLEVLLDIKKAGEEVALFISDQRMPEMEGVAFLEKARVIFPEAKRVLLTAYSDTDAAIKAINDVQLDYYLMKPWDPPEEKLFPILNDLLDEWQAGYIPDFDGLRILGYQFSPKTHSLKDFLSGNLFPFQWLDVETNEKAKELIALHALMAQDFPAVVLDNGTVLKGVTAETLAESIGLNPRAKEELYDVVIIGAGPAGLAAGVYGGSEGLKTLLVERRAPGGQAGTSSRIENYLGFPSGLSGADLSRRAITQATRFGVEFLSPQAVNKVEVKDPYKIITLANGSVIHTKSVVITTGVDYRKLDTKGLEQFTGAGVYYGAATTEAAACKDGDVFVVGGGNSAGQGAMYLSRFARKVFIVVRKEDLTSTMSSYLIDQINATPNIELVPCTEVTEAFGENERLTHLELSNISNGQKRKVEARAIFIFIGAKPYTEWLGDLIIKNEKGFIATGRDLVQFPDFKKKWKQSREPFALETCQPGVFAAGDVRMNAMNRVASAVGEGAMAISFVHRYLEEI